MTRHCGTCLCDAMQASDVGQEFYDGLDASEDDLDIVHIMTKDGCRISVNGQAHFPCKEH